MAMTYRQIGTALFALGKFKEAEDHFAQVQQLYSKKGISPDPVLLEGWRDTALCQQKQQKIFDLIPNNNRSVKK